MVQLRDNLDEIQNNPVSVNDVEFDDRINTVKTGVRKLHEKASRKLGESGQNVFVHLITKYLEGDDSQIQVQVGQLKDRLSETELLVKKLQSHNFPQIDHHSAQVRERLIRFEQERSDSFRS